MKISTLTKGIALSAFIAFTAYASAAPVEVVDLGVLEPGVEYSWPQYATVKGVYTPSETGPVKFTYSVSPFALYTSPDHDENSLVSGEFAYSDKGHVMSYPELKAGTPYYLYTVYSMDAGTLVIYEGSPEVKLNGTTPSYDPEDKNYYGGKLSASATYEIVVNFNFPITVGNTFLVAPDGSRVALTSKVNGTSVGCDVAPAMMELYHEGKLNEGDEVTLRLLQVTDASDSKNRYNGNGRCEIKFTVAGKPLELKSVEGADLATIDNVFNSYYLPGDENALVKFIFDGPLDTESKGVATITYGDSDNLEVGIYSENIEATHDGETAIFDFSGRLRRPIDMLPESNSSTQPEALYISFGNLKSPDGQRVYTSSKSNPTGFGASFNINVLQYTVVGDFTPARGGDLVFGSPMEIWVMNGDKIIYDTIRFEFTENGEEKYYDMPKEEVTEEADPYSDGAMLYTFVIPELNCDADTPIFVRMTGIQCADGLDHSNDVFGEFTRGVSGIADMEVADVENFDVYDVAGIRVMTNANRDALAGLAKGLYIVNGKKIVIR